MWLRICLVVLMAAAAGCSRNDRAATPPPAKGQKPEVLPPEVTGDPASALNQKRVRR